MKIIKSFLPVAIGIIAANAVQAQSIKTQIAPKAEIAAPPPPVYHKTVEPVTSLIPAAEQKTLSAAEVTTPSPYTKTDNKAAVNPALTAAQMKILNGTAVMPKQLNATADVQSSKQLLQAKPALINEQ